MPLSKPASSDPHSIPPLSSIPKDEEEENCTGPDQALYLARPPPKRTPLNRCSRIVAMLLGLIFIGLFAVPKRISHKPGDIEDNYNEHAPIPDSSGICKQSYMKQLPRDDISRALEIALESEDYLRDSVERLSGAVRISTESFDDMGPVGEDPRWETFQEFHNYLAKMYPNVYDPSIIWLIHRYSRLKVEKVNTWGLVYTWNGSNTDLKPSL